MNHAQLIELEQEHIRLGKRISEAITASREVGGIVGDITGKAENSALKRALIDFKKLSSKFMRRTQ